MADEDSNWVRSLMLGLGALLGISVLVGGIISMLALGAANVVGLGGGSDDPTRQPSLYIPSSSPTPKTEKPQQPPSSTASAPSPSPSAQPEQPTKSASPKRDRPKPQSIILRAQPQSVSTYERINLTGTYRGGNGVTLQVQRFEGGWVDFPTSATVSNGTFSTYVETGRGGVNRFRMIDRSTGRTSEPVAVTVR